ncbi:hypothetical protein GCM10027447_31440 [Glycomyces halotolerans]
MHTDIRRLTVEAWDRAVRERLVQPANMRENLMPLGEAEIDGLTVDFEWSHALQGVGAAFRHLAPQYIGYVCRHRDNGLRFMPGNLHRSWSDEPEHRQALYAIGSDLYERRKKLLGFDPLKRETSSRR